MHHPLVTRQPKGPFPPKGTYGKGMYVHTHLCMYEYIHGKSHYSELLSFPSSSSSGRRPRRYCTFQRAVKYFIHSTAHPQYSSSTGASIFSPALAYLVTYPVPATISFPYGRLPRVPTRYQASRHRTKACARAWPGPTLACHRSSSRSLSTLRALLTSHLFPFPPSAVNLTLTLSRLDGTTYPHIRPPGESVAARLMGEDCQDLRQLRHALHSPSPVDSLRPSQQPGLVQPTARPCSAWHFGK